MPNSSLEIEITQATELTEEICLKRANAWYLNLPTIIRRPPGSNWLKCWHPPFRFYFLRSTRIMAMRSLEWQPWCSHHVPTGLRGYVEDIVVDEKARGKRIGEILTRACLDHAKKAGAPQVMLTCNPGRNSANQMYVRMGFKLRKTNVYRYSFKRA